MTAVLVIWIGLAQSQTLTVTRFETMEECQAARAAIVEHYSTFSTGHISSGNAKCLAVLP